MSTKHNILVVCGFLSYIMPSVHAGDTKLHTQPDVLSSDRYQIVDSMGSLRGTLKSDSLDSRRIQITNNSGKPIGYIKPDPLSSSPKKYQIYNSTGDVTGTISQDVLWPKDRYLIFDRNGKKAGIVKRDVLRSGRWVIEK